MSQPKDFPDEARGPIQVIKETFMCNSDANFPSVEAP